MMASGKNGGAGTQMSDREPTEIEALLPFHAAGTLGLHDTRRVDAALASDPDLARQYKAIQDEYAETILLNESLGAPSVRAMQKLSAAIDAEPARRVSAISNLVFRLGGFFSTLSARTLALSAIVGAVALLLQAGVIGAILVKDQGASYQTASLSMNEPVTRNLGAGRPPRALLRYSTEYGSRPWTKGKLQKSSPT